MMPSLLRTPRLALMVLLLLGGHVGAADQEQAPAPAPARESPQLGQIRKQALTAVLVLTTGLFAGIAGLTLIWLMRKMGSEDPGSKLDSAKRDISSIVQLAKSSAERTKALEEERAVRERTEKDLVFNQQLLSKALEEKIQLGRDLHDGIIQSLYSAGLTLEALKSQVHQEPDQAVRKVDQTIAMLNVTIRDVRAFIKGLSPEALRASGFKYALGSLVDELRAGNDAAFDVRVDDHAASRLSLEQGRELIQVAREAISNALRHGRASAIAIYLGSNEEQIAFILRDNGAGFEPGALPHQGNGLRNMEARVRQLGGHWDLRAKPAEGVVISLFLPIIEAKLT